MSDKLLTFAVSSPEELNGKLAVARKECKVKYPYVALAVSGPKVIVRPFTLSNVARKDVKNCLKFEAVELLNLPIGDIALHYQILNIKDEIITGIFACIPKKLIWEYRIAASKARMIPVLMKPFVIASIDSFLAKNTIDEKRFAVLDFSKPNKINLAIFQNRKCEWLREIPYEDTQEAKNEIIQSMRSSCAKSATKDFNIVYMAGETLARNEFVSAIKKDFPAEIRQVPAIDVSAGLSAKKTFFGLNLLRRYALTLRQRKIFFKVSTGLFALLILICLGLFGLLKIIEKNIRDVQSSYTQADYQKALKLQKKLEAIKSR